MRIYSQQDTGSTPVRKAKSNAMSVEITKTTQNVSVHNWKEQRIQIQAAAPVVTTHLTEFHFKENGTVTGGPSFAIVTQQEVHSRKIITEFSLDTLKECLNAVGYEIHPVAEKNVIEGMWWAYKQGNEIFVTSYDPIDYKNKVEGKLATGYDVTICLPFSATGREDAEITARKVLL
jgi:uncharacterized secreted protein with C-terminal beta-propeller domain